MFFTLRYQQSQQILKAGIAFNCAILCSLVFLILVSGCATSDRIDGQINQYENNVFTNEGQSTVKGFEKKLREAHDQLVKVKNLRVWVGYHGNAQGNWYADFNNTEITDVERMAKMYPDAILKWTTPGEGLSDQIIRDEIKRGNVIFTWCDSDTRVKKVMKNSK